MHYSFFFFLGLFCSYFVYCSSAKCHKTTVVDVMFAIDSTNSMQSTLSTVKHVLPALLVSLKSKYHNSRFGLILFNWKPNACPIPYAVNTCPRIIQSLTSDENVLLTGLSGIGISGGSLDGKQDALGAMLVAALSDKIGWKAKKEKDVQRLRVVVIMTDDMYSLPNSVDSCSANIGSIGNIKEKYLDNDGDGDYQCGTEDFPSVYQVAAAFKKKKIFPLFLIANGREHLYTKLLDEIGIEGAARDIRTDSSNIVDILPSAIETFACSTLAPKTITTTIATTSVATRSVATRSVATRSVATRSVATRTVAPTPIVRTPIATITEDASTEAMSTFSTTAKEDEAKFPILGVAIGAALGGLLIAAAMTAVLLKQFRSVEEPMDAVFESISVDMSPVDKNIAASIVDDAFI